MNKLTITFLTACLSHSLVMGLSRNTISENNMQTDYIKISTTSKITEIESGFSAVKFEGDDGFSTFINSGGATSDSGVIKFLTRRFVGASGIRFEGNTFGCSTLSVSGTNGEQFFGRNFDWNKCNALVVENYPADAYASISTVNMDFIRQGMGMSYSLIPDSVKTIAAIYAPLDGMNEKGLAVSVNMISDNSTIEQNTNKPDITTTTAVRLLLNKAANVEEAIELLKTYDFHASFGYMVHLSIADSSGNSVVVEYINNEISVIKTPILTNFYLTPGNKYGIGTSQSHERFSILEKKLSENPVMTNEQVRDALSSVSKGNFGEFESTEWSIVFDLTNGIANYFHREKYNKCFVFSLLEK